MPKASIRDQILSVIRDGSRIDRFVQSGVGGGLFLTTRDDSCDQIEIGCGFDTTETEDEQLADYLAARAESELV